MAKTKKKQAEKVLNKKSKSNAKKSVNPFEVHINKQKYQVLGQKLKHDRGLPGVSRARALQKRKDTLLPEYHIKNKSNKFMDRRIGEQNYSMTEEDRQMARFTAERVKHHNKKSIFNLADDEILTHRGQTLNEIEKFDDPRSDDEDDEMQDGRKKSGKLADRFVRDAHFGGGMLTKTGVEGTKSHKDLIDQLIAESKKRKAEKQKIREQTVELTEKLDTEWKDLLPIVKTSQIAEAPEVRQKPDDYDKFMRELRFEARGNPTDRLKGEDEIAKEEKEKLEKLEQDRLDRMRGVIEDKSSKKSHRSADDLDDNFAYDSEPEETLTYEDGKLIKANVPTDLIIADEIEQNKYEDNPDEESEEGESSEAETDDDLSDLKQSDSESDFEESKQPVQNKKLVKENTVAMEVAQYNEEPVKKKVIENITKKKVRKEEKMEAVQYNEEPVKKKVIENITKKKVRKEEKIEEKSSEESTSEDSDTKQSDDLEESKQVNKPSNKVSKEDNDGCSESEDDDSDTKRLDLEESEELVEEDKFKNTSKQVKEIKFQKSAEAEFDKDSTELNPDKEETNLQECNTSIKLQSKKRKLDEVESDEPKTQIIAPEILEIMEKAKKELPYTYSLPDSYETLQSIFNQQPPEYQDVIIERMIKCNHPSLGAENKENLSKLFIYLLQHLNDMVPDENPSEDEMKHCFAVLNSVTPHLYSLTQLNPINAKESLIEVINEKQNEYKVKPKHYPGVDVLIFLKLISCLFSTSDFRHQVVTPSLVFIGQMLTTCKIKNRYDITYGLFLVTLYLEYTTLSKRYMPSVLIYMSGILHMTVPKLGVKLLKIIPPFKPNAAALVIVQKHKKCTTELKLNSSDFVHKEINENFKLRALFTNLKLLQEFHGHWKELPSHVEIFQTVAELLGKIPKENYPNIIQSELDQVKMIVEDAKLERKIELITAAKRKPKALRLYEPNIQKVYEGRSFKPMSKERADREKLVHKYKKEMKGALREIRRDKSFLGRVKIKQQIQSDHERKEKVRQIYSEASMQQGELNALDRKKKRK